MERVVFENVWKMYDRRFGSNRFRKMFATFMGHHPERHEFWALRDVSFRLEEGHSLGVIGPNGSGKTTVLRLLSGISQVDRGHIKARGTIAALIALGAGFHPELTGRENIYLNGSILGLTRAEINSYFDSIVEFANIAEYIDSPVKRYSSGMFVRLGFAVAAQVRPDILLVDEVLAVGDARFQARCHERIAELRRDGTITILVSHDLWTIRQSCQEGLFIKNGQVEARGDINSVIEAYNKQIQREALLSMSENAMENGPKRHSSCEMVFMNDGGEEVTEVDLGKPITIRLRYDLLKPIQNPLIEVDAMSHDGPRAMALRSRTAGWHVHTLQGEGYIDISLEEMHLNPGRYACAFRIVSDSDSSVRYESHFCEIFIKPPGLDWGYESCYYMPEAQWSDVCTTHERSSV